MSRLAPALRLRRRQLDGLRTAIAAERERGAMLEAAANALAEQRRAERVLGPAGPSADAWFAAAARRLDELGRVTSESNDRLADLRATALDARARLTLLEEAEAEALGRARREADKRAEAALADRTAATWIRRA